MRRSDEVKVGMQAPMWAIFEALDDLRNEGFAVVDVDPDGTKGLPPEDLVSAMRQAAEGIIDELNTYEGEREHVEVEVDADIERTGQEAINALTEQGYAVLAIQPADLGVANPDEVCRHLSKYLPQLIDELKSSRALAPAPGF